MPPLFVRILVDDWHDLLPWPWAQIALVLVAVACGGVVGGDRERREKPAGLRTLMLVSLGAAIFTMAGYTFTSKTGDSGRVAAQIVTGIGFLGAGAILHGHGSVSGMTTAATIWLTAAIGMITATGYAGGALGASILARLILLGVERYEIRRLGGLKAMTVEIDFAPEEGKTRAWIERILVDYRPGMVAVNWTPVGEQRERLTLQLRLANHHLRDLLGELADLSPVLSIRPTA
jgi:putative Mg2+ transporter-C (MgtC) family protein